MLTALRASDRKESHTLPNHRKEQNLLVDSHTHIIKAMLVDWTVEPWRRVSGQPVEVSEGQPATTGSGDNALRIAAEITVQTPKRLVLILKCHSIIYIRDGR